jgi:hypothetical protein
MKFTMSEYNPTLDEELVAAYLRHFVTNAHGALFIDELERLARSDPKFLSALQIVAGPFTKEADVSNRIVRAAGAPLPFVDDNWP